MAKQLPKIEDDLTKQTLKELAPLAKEIIDLVTESTVKIGEIHAKDYQAYDITAKNVMRLMLERNMKYMDKELLKSLVLQPFDQVMGIVIGSLTKSYNLTLDKVLGKELYSLTLEDLDQKMKE